MIDEYCEVPREDLDGGFNPCRKQVVENGGLEAYAHMYDVMNERYDREEDTSYLNSVKRDRITRSTPSQTVGEGKLYAQDAQGVEGFVKSSETLHPTTHAEIPSSKAVADYAPIPLPISKGGTGAQTAQGALANLLPHTTSIASATGALVYDVDSGSTYLRAISGESSGYQTDLVNRAGIQAIIDAHSLNTPPSPFSYQIAPYPSGTWEGEMTVNVVPVFSVTIGAVEYIMARVYGAKKFNYNGSADNISLFSSIQIVEEYPYIFKDGTSIPLAVSIQGRSYTAGTYGFNPSGSGSDVLLNNQTVMSVLSSANLNMSNRLNCVFGTGTNTPGVTVSLNCLTLMWRNLS